MKFLKKYFYVPKYGKVSDKMMVSRVVNSASVIIACLAALSFSAYAWFSYNVSSGANTISAAAFGVEVAVYSDASEEIPAEDVYNLGNGEYTVQLNRTGNATNGFCIVKVTVNGAETAYHTRQIPKDTGLTLKLNLSNLTEPVAVEFIPSWGTSVYYGTTGNPLYLDNDQLEISGSADNGTNEESGQEQMPDESTQEQPSQPEQAEIIHTVVEGENLTWIAEEYGSTVDAIAERNNIADKRTIQIGQQLIIPPAETE